MEQFRTFIQALFSSDDVKWEPVITLKRNEHLTTPGSVSSNLYWIEEGAIRAYFLSEDQEQVIRLGYPDSLIADLPSVISGKPSEVHLQAIKKTRVRPLSKGELDRFIYANEEHMRLYIALMHEFVTQQIDREMDILTSSPLDRFQRCLQRSPQLFQHIPARHIATYLNMSEETLSRLKKRTLKQNQ